MLAADTALSSAATAPQQPPQLKITKTLKDEQNIKWLEESVVKTSNLDENDIFHFERICTFQEQQEQQEQQLTAQKTNINICKRLGSYYSNILCLASADSLFIFENTFSNFVVKLELGI
eukprot:Pgem_evm1s11898